MRCFSVMSPIWIGWKSMDEGNGLDIVRIVSSEFIAKGSVFDEDDRCIDILGAESIYFW